MILSMFQHVLKASIAASAVGIAVLLVKKIWGTKINRKWHFLIWFLLIIKLIIPAGPESFFSLFNLVDYGSPPEPRVLTAVENYAGAGYSRDDMPVKIPAGENLSRAADKGYEPAEAAAFIWITVSAVIFLWFSGTVFYTKYRLKSACILSEKQLPAPVKYRVVIQEFIKSPASFGIIKPKILLPEKVFELKDEEINYILMHECAHLNRKDNITNVLLIFLQCIHWFNPVIWYCFKQIRKDMEYGADERVIKKIGERNCRDYCETLIQALKIFGEGMHRPGLIYMTDYRRDMEKRLKIIKNTMDTGLKKNKSAGFGIASFLILGLLFLTSATRYSQAADLQYIDLKTLSGYDTVYTGDVSKVGRIVENMPPLSEFYDQRYISLETDSEPYGLNIYYEYNNRDDGVNNIFMTSCAENNAMILFAFIENLDYVNFAFRSTPSEGSLEQAQYTDRYLYLRQDFEDIYGPLSLLKEDLGYFQNILNQNHFIDGGYIHYNRIMLGNELFWVLYRNGDPDFTYTAPNGAAVERVFYNYPGGTVVDVEFDENETVKRVYIEGDSEILLNCNIMAGTYEETIRNLGKPASEIKEGNLTTLIYSIKGQEDYSVFFTFNKGFLESHGMEILHNENKMIKAVGINGVDGWIYEKDLTPVEINTPEEAIHWTESKPEYWEIIVYGEDKITPVDIFKVY